MVSPHRPTGHQQIAVAAVTNPNVHLEQMRRRGEVLNQQLRLIVMPAAGHIPVDFLQAHKVRLFGIDDGDDALEIVLPIAAANAFVNVVTQ